MPLAEAEVAAVLSRALSAPLPPDQLRELTERLRLAEPALALLHALPLDHEDPAACLPAPRPLFAERQP